VIRIASTLLKSAVLAAVLLGATAAQAQVFRFSRLPSESAVREAMIRQLRKLTHQIDDFIAAAVNAGFAQVVANERVEMINNGTVSLSVRLEYGSAYAFAARCGSDCHRLRLVLKNASGQVVKKSVDHLNDKPAFIFRPEWTGVYALSLEPAGCSAARCQVGAVILSQPDHQKTWRDVFTSTAQTASAIKQSSNI
jgi:hypothetical protein